MSNQTNIKPNDVNARIVELETELKRLNKEIKVNNHDNSISLVCFSGDWDRLFAAFTIANGALALGKEVHMFFTFWGASAIRKKGRASSNEKNWIQKLLSRLLPKDISATPLSKMNYGGLGKVFMRKLMRDKGVDDLQTLMDQAQELGAHFHYCDTSLQLFGLCNDDLIEDKNADWCGVSSFLSLALNGRITLFI